MRRSRIPDRVLVRWLASGRPRRVARRAATDSETAARLEHLSALPGEHARLLAEWARPDQGFGDRALDGVTNRLWGYQAVTLLADLLGVGWRTGQAVFGEPTHRRGRDDSHEAGAD